ncbi:phospholipase [Microbacterium sp. HMWF026]|uniref:aggregation-promoting factor C-terminal-like domain-containing protein n=1 Tax=Microbacterium sp. HMWF026 TaxID=2056861 RepID=UPI000D3B5610|nr:phospholipase [Microbacterium sp. HMWF026]PTT18291.1 phospholipase [Microbacterium sp. HMWF026]
MLRSDMKLVRVHRARRTLVTAATCAGLALGLVATTGLAMAAPVSLPDASASSFAAPGSAVTISSAPTLDAVTTGADSAMTDAQAALASATAVQADVASTELPLSIGDATVDTSALQDAVDRLGSSDLLPVLMVPALSQNAQAETERVSARVAEVQGSLDQAKAAKAAADAAAEAQRQAEKAAADAAAAQAQREAEAAATLARVNTPAGAKDYAAQLAAEKYGWGSDQFSCLASLWTKESGWNYQAYNNDGGATGIPQALPGSKMATFGADWQTNAATQIAWGLDYISRGYGTPCSAWGHSQAMNWY